LARLGKDIENGEKRAPCARDAATSQDNPGRGGSERDVTLGNETG
jgi:hypothetical protein